jgi:hypothetical protein
MVAYLTTRPEKIILSQKIIEKDLSRVEKCATKSTYKLSIGFERCEDKGKKSAHKFIPSSTYHKEEATIKFTKAHSHIITPHVSKTHDYVNHKFMRP